MKKQKRGIKALLIITTILLVFIALYFGLYIYAKITPKLAIDGANGYYLYDNKEKLYTGTASELDKFKRNFTTSNKCNYSG